MKVLVTGATGFLGGWLVRRLAQDGLDVRIIKRPKTSLDELADLQKLEVFPGDVTDLESLQKATKDVDSVFHLAGLIAYTRAQRAAMENVNVQGTANVLQACAENSVRRLLHLSSVTAIGASFDGRQPLNENSPYNLEKLNLGYFETKRKAEELVRKATQAGRVDAVIINPSTIYGPGDAKKGSRSTQLKVARGKFPFYTSGGVNVVSIEDAVHCIVEGWRVGRTGERYIVAGQNLTIKELFEVIASEAGVQAPRYHLPTPAVHLLGKIGDLMEAIGKKGPISSENAWTSTLYHWFDSSKAQRELGLKPRPAREAIRASVAWIKANGLA
jgi:dihydroflavonol-4-reductase